MSSKVSIVIEKDEHGFFHILLNWKGCHTQGETVEETMENMKEAIELYMETLPTVPLWQS